jgi:hypothetical protein
MSKKFAKSLFSGRVGWLGYMGCGAGTLPHGTRVLFPSGPAQGRSVIYPPAPAFLLLSPDPNAPGPPGRTLCKVNGDTYRRRRW